MPNSFVNAYLYENLKEIYRFNERTKLCICETTGNLFIVKSVALSCEKSYQSLQSLNNLHLAKIYHISKKEDHIEVVQEYIPGDTLACYMKKNQVFKRDMAIKIAADICDGLAEMHKLGYVHRDITPNNIIVSSEGCVKIIDYGISRCFFHGKNADTAILGTPGYAAPEQFGFSQSDARTDIYAVGVLLNVMLTGEMPNRKRATGTLGKIIEKCVEVDSRQRYETICDLKNALYNIIPRNNRLDYIIKQIPGIRSTNVLIVILSVFCYICAIIFSIAIFSTIRNNAYLQTFISWFLFFVVPFFCFHNFLGIWDILPFSKGASKRNQRIVYTIFGIAAMLFGLISFGLIYSP